MKYEIDINDDMFDELLIQRLMSDYEMIKSDLFSCPHEEDITWLVATKNALETLILTYYSDPLTRKSFLQEIANGN